MIIYNAQVDQGTIIKLAFIIFELMSIPENQDLKGG
jgi:hypothetical protein